MLQKRIKQFGEKWKNEIQVNRIEVQRVRFLTRSAVEFLKVNALAVKLWIGEEADTITTNSLIWRVKKNIFHQYLLLEPFSKTFMTGYDPLQPAEKRKYAILHPAPWKELTDLERNEFNG